MMRTANPALNKKSFATFDQVLAAEDKMTIQGTVNKTFISLFLLMGGAMFTWKMYFSAITPEGIGDMSAVMPWMIGGGIGGFVIAMVTIFKKTWSPYTAPIYAILEGLMLGGLSAFMESMFPGIVLQAVALTFGTLFSLLFAYKSNGKLQIRSSCSHRRHLPDIFCFVHPQIFWYGYTLHTRGWSHRHRI